MLAAARMLATVTVLAGTAMHGAGTQREAALAVSQKWFDEIRTEKPAVGVVD